MPRRFVAVMLLVAGVALGALLRVSPGDGVPLAAASSLLLIVLAVACGLATLPSSRSPAVLRLDWYLPVLRRAVGPAESFGPLLSGLRARLPAGWLSDRGTKRRGALRRALRAAGLSWLASPLRRVSQTVCFVAFLVLFFWVCWPYDARPVEPGNVATGWGLAELDQAGQLRLTRGSGSAAWIARGRRVHLSDEAAHGAGGLGACEVVRVEAGGVTLRPRETWTVEQLDQVLISGPWTLSERPLDAWPTHYADRLAAKERLAADVFLAIDPLVSLSTALAARSWVWSLVSAAVILVVCVLVPRGFCGYICPLGTLIDLFDGSIGKRVTRFRVASDGWWVHTKYYLLLATLVAAAGGVLVSGYVAAIPVVTRGMLFFGEPLQSGLLRGWHQVPPIHSGHVLSLALFLAVLALGLLRPRFWCKYVCPSGAVFSLGNLFRISERKVESSCIHCNKCVEVCPFDAIKPDFTTRVTDCTLCQTCAGVCPTQAIKFVERSNRVELKVANEPPTGETALGRRGFLSAAAGTAAAVAGGAGWAAATRAFGAGVGTGRAVLPVRPPGSVPEQDFLQLCIRCGECFKVCPNNVLQPLAWQQGLEGLWTPFVQADWAGCESSCNACGQVCPTGAIRALPMEEKRFARMGLAVVNTETCLPFAAREACQLCVDECDAAGYEAIEFTRVHTQVDPEGRPVEGSGFLAPVVREDLCVGCGLCQTRCYVINSKEKKLLGETAILVEAGEGKEDRITHGSYRQLRRREQSEREQAAPASSSEYFVPQAEPSGDTRLPSGDAADPAADPNPFGL